MPFERIETFYLHLGRTITAESFIRAFTCMRVVSSIAGSLNSVNCIPTVAIIVALESRPILGEFGSASVANWNPAGQSTNMTVEMP